MTKELDPNAIFLGFMIGFFVALLMFWYATKDTPSCYDYDRRLDSIDEPCIPDYMGGCN